MRLRRERVGAGLGTLAWVRWDGETSEDLCLSPTVSGSLCPGRPPADRVLRPRRRRSFVPAGAARLAASAAALADVQPAPADISGRTSCKKSEAFQKQALQGLKKRTKHPCRALSSRAPPCPPSLRHGTG